MPNTALNRTTQALLTNKSGGALVYGDVVVLDNTNASSFTTTTTAGLDTRGLGVILEPNGIANNASGMVAIGGWCPKVNLNTAATVGQLIKTHTVAGQATPHSSPQVAGDFAYVLEASATPAAMLFGKANASAGTGDVTHTGTLTSGTLIQGNGGVDITLNATTATVTKLTAGVPSAATASTDYLAPAAWMVCGRLTTESGVAVSTTNRSAQATIYWTPYNGDTVPLYTGSAWIRLAFAEISLALSGLTSGKNYDVFVYNNTGTLALELSAAWTNDTTRADALALQNGLYVKSGTTTRLWVGTIRTTGTTTTEDSLTKRFVWNAYNQVRRSMQAIDTTDTWTYTTATWRQANASTANQLAFVIGYQQSLTASITVSTNNGNGPNRAISVGEDSTTTPSTIKAFTSGGASEPLYVPYDNMLSAGYHFLAWLEYSGVGGTTTWFGDAGLTFIQSGITGTVWN